MALDLFRTLRWAWKLPIWLLLVACSAVHTPPATSRPTMSAEDEARAIDAARHHPIARPEPRTLYPEQTPPPLPDHGTPALAPPGMQASALATAAAPASETIVAPTAPPSDYVDQPQYAAPGSDYVWTPGYWAWSGGGYIWVAGDWLRSRPGYEYLGPRWARTGYGWQFSVGGWARGGTGIVAYPAYRYPYAPYQPYYAPGYYSARRLGASGYYGGRSGYQAPPSRYSGPTGHIVPERRGSYHDSYEPSRGSGTRSDRATVQASPSGSRPTSAAPRAASSMRGGDGGGRSPRATVRTRH
jgi:hypothetical protein